MGCPILMKWDGDTLLKSEGNWKERQHTQDTAGSDGSGGGLKLAESGRPSWSFAI